MKTQRNGGFTLIELMITVAIVAIIAAVALPSFQSQIRAGRRSDAIAALSQIQQTQERWRANNPSYTDSITGAWPNTGLGLSTTSSGGYYTLAIDPATVTSSGYTVTATGTGSQANDTNCTTLTVTIASGTITQSPATCWKK